MRGRVIAAALVILPLTVQIGYADLAGDAYRLMRYWYGTIWSQDFQEGTDIAADLTCDGVADRVFAWRDGVNPEGEYFHVALVSGSGGGAGWERLPDVVSGLLPLRLDVGTGAQFALCDNRREPFGAGYRATMEPVPEGARTRFALLAACARWLRIDDGMCDALWVGYDPAQQKFILDRN
ncbi:hypothetical protein KFF05_04240 [bacterium SCSIO 12827]|nr:hypothetical protein KFF05_04240 [bacterium SCSIO 12827]